MLEEARTVYVSRKKIEGSGGNPPMWHVDADCYQIRDIDAVEMTVADARDQCARQAQCCSTMPALEDLD